MIKFNSIGQIEHGKYAFADAVAENDTFNGAFGVVADGKFDVAEDGMEVIMQIERGDDMDLAKFPIVAGTHVRVLDLAKRDGELFEIYGYPMPATFAKADKLKVNAKGELEVGAVSAPYLLVEEVIGNKAGAVVKVVAE